MASQVKNWFISIFNYLFFSHIRCEFCPSLKLQKFNLKLSKNGRKKEEKNSNKEEKLKKLLKGLNIVLGHGQKIKTISEAVDKLMERNYPDLVNWNGRGCVKFRDNSNNT